VLKQNYKDNENCKWLRHFSLHIELKLQTLKEAKPEEITAPSTETETLIYSVGYNTRYFLK
jgi:hypothetical protein